MNGYSSMERHIVTPEPGRTRAVRLINVVIELEDAEGWTHTEEANIATFDGAEEAAYRLYLHEQQERRLSGLEPWENYQIKSARDDGRFMSTIVHAPAALYQMPGEKPTEEARPDAARAGGRGPVCRGRGDACGAV